MDTPLQESYWRSLRYLNLYRFVLAILLFAAAAGIPSDRMFADAGQARLHFFACAVYLLLTGLAVLPIYQYRHRFNLQLSIHVLIDIGILTTLMYAGGGLRSGFAALLFVLLAAAGLVGQGRLVLLYAALATLAVLGTESYRALGSDFEPQEFLNAGLLSIGFFAVAASARLLARRVLTNEELARQRGVALANQMLISQRAFDEMQDGVLVVGEDGMLRQFNPRAAAMLGLAPDARASLAECAVVLADDYIAWRSGLQTEAKPFRVAASELTLRARFVATESSERDVLVFLEDMGRVHERARQIKLAALGRLTANIAHEIRNPLSAISHAGELLMEERRGEPQERLLRILRDNTQRLDRIVRDVLELGRRDRVHREAIDCASFFVGFAEDFCSREGVAAETVRVAGAIGQPLLFDRSHLHQVMWNLLSNALRHCSRQPGSIVLTLDAGEMPGRCVLDIVDDGCGIPEAEREHVFEPFFTTHSRGTGLGLYIARELCEANGARLEYVDNAPGAHFRIRGELAGDNSSY